MRLIVAEKPSQARSIAQAIGVRGRSTDGAIEGDDVTITWCIGHLVGLAMPEDYSERYEKWRPEDLPIIPEETKLLPGKQTKKQWQTVKKLMTAGKVKEIVNATDSGREGELIFDNVYRLSGSKKPVLRLWTSSLTEDAIRSSYHNLKSSSEFSGLRDAARSRAEADWLIGINATRLETLTARSLGKQSGVYPVGRVQTPTLALICQREEEITNFTPKDFWTVVATFQQETAQYKGKWVGKDSDRFDDEKSAQAIIDKVTGKIGKVVKHEEKKRVKKPQLLYDLTSLQRRANQKYGFTADKTLTICQSLYENHKVLSYPRTNSRYLTENEAAGLFEVLKKTSDLPKDGGGAYGDLLEFTNCEELPSRYVNAKKVEDHHAIIPTGLSSSSLSEDEAKIFDMVLRRTIGAFCKDRIDVVLEVETVVEDETFRTSGMYNEEPGYAQVEPDLDKEEDSTDSVFKVDPKKASPVKEVASQKGKTTPPKRFNEASLLSKMENAGRDLDDEELKEALKEGGLGTPATRSAIIEGLKSRGLVAVRGKNLSPTVKGMSLISQVPDGPLKSPELTGDWERKLTLMARGEYERHKFMVEIESLTKEMVDSRKGAIKISAPSAKEVGDCPKCESTLLLKEYESRKYVKCSSCDVAYGSDESGKPSAGYCKKSDCDGPVTKTKKGSLVCVLCGTWQESIADENSEKCPTCNKSHLLRRKGKSGYFWGCASYPSCKATFPDKRGKPDFEAKKASVSSEHLCKECGKGLVRRKSLKKKNTFFWGCSGFPGCKQIYFDRDSKPVFSS